MQSVYTILLLIVSNIFMTCAWYGHLKMKQQFSWFEHLPLFGTIAFKGESFKWNHALAFVFLVAAVYLVFKK